VAIEAIAKNQMGRRAIRSPRSNPIAERIQTASQNRLKATKK